MILYAIILLSFNLLMFVECDFRESMCVLVVLYCSLCDPITIMIIMILPFGLIWCLEFFF